MTQDSNKPDIDYLLDEVISLPSLPGTVSAIMRMVSDPQCSLSAVAQAISADPPLALKTLRLVNTAYYGLRQKITMIEHAVVLLGAKVIKNLVFTATVFDMMRGGMDGFFRHSVCCGMATRALVESGAVRTPAESADEVFVFGLLHDIGKVILAQYMPDEHAAVGRMCREQQVPWFMAEREVIGIDHAQLGARLAQKWKLPMHLIGAIEAHHAVEQCSRPDLQSWAVLVAVADYMCSRCGIVAQGDTHTVPGDEVWKLAAIHPTNVPRLMEDFFSRLPSVDELMQLTA